MNNTTTINTFNSDDSNITTQQTFVLMKTSSRRLDEDEYILINHTSSRRLQDVLVKTNIFILSIRLQDVFKTFSRRLQDIFKTSSKRLQDVSQIRLEDIFKTF